MNRTTPIPANHGQRIHDTMTLHRDVIAAESDLLAARDTLGAIKAGGVRGLGGPDAVAHFAAIVAERETRTAVLRAAQALFFTDVTLTAAAAIERATTERAA